MHHDSDTTNTHSTASSDANDVNNLLLRLYNTVLTNSLVQTGMKQLSGLTQPIIGKYEDLVAVKSNVSNWVTNGNVYNFLVNQWLADNLPYNGTVATYDVFVKGLDRLLRNGSRHQHEFDSRTFYEFASQVWLTQSHPDLEDIKNSMLVVVARVVNKKYRFEEEALAQGLYNMLRMLIEKRRELVSAESFFNLVKMSLEGDYFERYTQIVKSACDEYYSFARRFLLVDFPLVATNKNFIKVTIKFLQDNLLIHGDSTLNFIERQLDYLLNFFGQKANGSLEDHSIIEKSQRILKKAYVLSVFPFKKIENQMYHLCDNRVVNTMDKYIHFSDRIDEAIGLTAWGYRTLKENILDPTVGAVRLVKDKTTSQLVVVLHGLDPRVIRKRWNKLRNQYDILKQCAVIVEQGVVKIIMDKKTREELSEEAKKELMRFYQEVKTLERQKIADVTMGYYVQILKKAKKTYKTAKKNVQYQQVQAASQVKQVVHAKEEQQVEMPDSESSASEEELKSTAVEATA